MKNFEANLTEIEAYFKNDLKRILGVEAVKFFKSNFLQEGFTDQKKTKWKEVKRRTDGKTKGAKASKKILSDSKQLQDSIEYKIVASGINIVSDSPYAQIHNEGGFAGRGGTAKIEKRQFIGESAALNTKLKKIVDQDLDKITAK